MNRNENGHFASLSQKTTIRYRKNQMNFHKNHLDYRQKSKKGRYHAREASRELKQEENKQGKILGLERLAHGLIYTNLYFADQRKFKHSWEKSKTIQYRKVVDELIHGLIQKWKC